MNWCTCSSYVTAIACQHKACAVSARWKHALPRTDQETKMPACSPPCVCQSSPRSRTLAALSSLRVMLLSPTASSTASLSMRHPAHRAVTEKLLPWQGPDCKACSCSCVPEARQEMHVSAAAVNVHSSKLLMQNPMPRPAGSSGERLRVRNRSPDLFSGQKLLTVSETHHSGHESEPQKVCHLQ